MFWWGDNRQRETQDDRLIQVCHRTLLVLVLRVHTLGTPSVLENRGGWSLWLTKVKQLVYGHIAGVCQGQVVNLGVSDPHPGLLLLLLPPPHVVPPSGFILGNFENTGKPSTSPSYC